MLVPASRAGAFALPGPILYMDDCTQNRVKYEDSCILVPDGPGLGIEVDEAHLGEIAYKGKRLRRLKAGTVAGR